MPQNIPDGNGDCWLSPGPALNSTVSVTGVPGNVSHPAQITINVAVNHNYAGDLDVSLTPPMGRPIPLILRLGSGPCGSPQRFSGANVLSFNIAHTSYIPVQANSSFIPPGNYLPTSGAMGGSHGNLNLLTGAPFNGDWTLTLIDGSRYDAGQLHHFSIEITTCANPSNGGIITGNQSICVGNQPMLLMSSVAASGFIGELEYQWQSTTSDPAEPGFDPAGWGIIPSGNSTDYQPTALTQTTWFRRLAKVECEPDWSLAASSNVVRVAVDPAPEAVVTTYLPGFNLDFAPSFWSNTSTNGGTYFFDGTNSLELSAGMMSDATAGATVTIPSAGTISFSWDYTAILSPPTSEAFGFVLNGNPVQLTNFWINNQNGTVNTLHVNEGDVFGFWLSSETYGTGLTTALINGFSFNPQYAITICNNVSFVLEASVASSANGSILWTHDGGGQLEFENTLQPRYIPTNSDAGNIVTLTLTVTGLNACAPTAVTAQYRIMVEACCINPNSGGIIASNQAFCTSGTPSLLGSNAEATGHTGTLEYKWQFTTSDPQASAFDPASWTDIASSNSTTFQPGELLQTTWYRRLARVECEDSWNSAASSNIVRIAIVPEHIFITENGAGLMNGSDWANALPGTAIQDALDNAVCGNVIWIAKGRYVPTTEIGGGHPRFRSFSMKPGVQMLGGFSGEEDPLTFDITTRDFETNETILDGDLNGDDLVTGDGTDFMFQNYGDNAHRVVLFREDLVFTNSTIIDGFTIRGGNSNLTLVSGAIHIDRASPLLKNLVIKESTAHSDNGAVRIYGGSPVFENCLFTKNLHNMVIQTRTFGVPTPLVSRVTINNSTFRYNKSSYAGAIYLWNRATLLMDGCVFEHNTSTSSGGGAIAVWDGELQLKNSVVRNNFSPGDGGGIRYSYFGAESLGVPKKLILENVDIINNQSQSIGGGLYADVVAEFSYVGGKITGNSDGTTNYLGAGGIYLTAQSSATVVLDRLLVRNNTSNSNGSGGIMVNAAPYSGGFSLSLKNSQILYNSSAVRGNGGGVGLISSLAYYEMENLLIAGNIGYLGGGIFIGGSNRILKNVTISRNVAHGNSAIFCTAYSLVNSIVWDNTSLNYPYVHSFRPEAVINSTVHNEPGMIIPQPALGGIDVADPFFVDPDGGDFRLMQGSPLIDQGNNSYSTVDFDVRGAGFSRRLNGADAASSGTVDRGALEFNIATDCILPTDGGAIGSSQVICSGSVPAMINSLSVLGPAYGPITYKWQFSTSDPSAPDFDPASWTDVPSSNSTTYQPAVLTETTWFRRLSKVDCSEEWTTAAPSNIVGITTQTLSLNMAGQMPAGLGTSSNPYLIANFDNLLWMAANTSSWNKHFLQTADIDAALTSNACFNQGAGWLPLGTWEMPFEGKYNGDFHSVSNLYINRPTSERTGFFGFTNHLARIENLELIAGDVTGGEMTGMLVGESRGEIVQCSASGIVSGAEYTGGLIGITEGNGKIIRSYANTQISTSGLAGGLTGYLFGRAEDSYAMGSIQSATPQVVAGLAGFIFQAHIENCYAAVSFNIPDDNFKAGLTFYKADPTTGGNNFFDQELAGTVSSSFGSPKTTTEMTSQPTFTGAGWDFNSPIWLMDPSVNQGYPFHSWRDRWTGVIHDIPEGAVVYDDTWNWNGAPVDWIVVDKYDRIGYNPPYYHEIVLLTRQHIHEMPYRIGMPDNNYEYSSVRQYLNSDFYGSFSKPSKDIVQQREHNWTSSYGTTVGQSGFVVDMVFLPSVEELGGPLSPGFTRSFSYFNSPDGPLRRAAVPGFFNMTRSGIFRINPPANEKIYWVDLIGYFFDAQSSYSVIANSAVRPAVYVNPSAPFIRQPDGRYKLHTHRVLYTAVNGTIQGSGNQFVLQGASSENVVAQPNAGYKFLAWSDGNTNPQRSENNVTSALSFQALFEPCLNPENGGVIAGNQLICAGETPGLITSVTNPPGFMGTIEYQWQYSLSNPAAPGFDPSSWVNINSSNTNTYQPDAITQTTWFRRMAGVTCESERLASNVVMIEVRLYQITASGGEIIFDDACGRGETLNVYGDAGNIVFDVSGQYYSLNGGAPQAFPANLLLSEVNQITINTGLGDDVINVGGFTTPMPSFTINGGQGDDVVNFVGDITFAPSANLDVDLQNDHASPGEDVVNVAANAKLTFQGGGSPVIKVSKWMTVDTGGSLEVQDGDIVLEINQQDPPTIGNFHGLILPGLLRSTGEGNIIVKTKAGKNAPGFMIGMWMHNMGRIESTGTVAGKGNILIEASVDDGFQGGAAALFLQNNTQISSAGGDIYITLISGNGTHPNINVVANSGLNLNDNGTIAATGPANIRLDIYTGYLANGANYAVNLRSEGSKITAENGNITMDIFSAAGVANTGFISNIAMFMFAGSHIKATGNGNISIYARTNRSYGTGTGAQTIRFDTPSYIRSFNGDITIVGLNLNNEPETGFNHGLSIRGDITSTGIGNIFLEGTAGTPNSVFNLGSQGVQIRNGATVSSVGGNVRILGNAANIPANEAITIARVGNGTVSINDPSKSITFESNSFDIHPSNGMVNAGGGTVIFKGSTAGQAIDLGGPNAPGILGLADAQLDRVTAGSLIIGDPASGNIAVSADISRPASTNMQLVSNGSVTFTAGGINTNGGTLLLDPGDSPAAVFPDFDGTDVTASTLSFGSDLGIIINGNTPGDGTSGTYTQLTVSGIVDLTGVNLVLSGTHTPVAPETYLILNNLGSQPVAGTFTGLPEGAFINNVLGSGLPALITYTGGDGNDVVLNLCSNPTSGGTIADNQTICYNSQPTAFTSISLPGGFAGTLEYKWQMTTTDPAGSGFDPANWTDIASSNAATHQATSLNQTTWFRRLARVDCSTSWSGAAASNVIQVTVRPQFTPGAIATAGETICYGGTPSTIGSVSAASGGDGNITYSWRSSSDNFTASITGATSSSYTPPAGLTSTTTYRRYANDGTCNTVPEQSTGEWTVTVRPDFTPGAIATAGETICYGGTPSTIGSVSAASGGDGNITYSWRSSSDNFTASITGANSSSYTPPAGLTSTTTYRRYANDGTCNTVPEQSTGEWTVTVRPDFTPGAIATAGETICYGGTPSTIGSVSAASGGDGNITYSWRSSSDNFTASITGANSSSYTPPAGLTSTTTYRRYANDGTCNTVPEQSTGEWTVTVRPDFTPGAIATAGETICYGGTPSTIGSVSAASGGDGNITYSWRSSSDNFTASITGANSSSYTPPAGLTSTTTYRRYANDGTCNTAPEQSTGEWTVTVRPDFTTGAIATAGETICYGGTPSTIGSVSAASGGDGNITYSWRSSSDNFTASITGANSSSYTPPAGLTSTTTYRRYANDGTCNTAPEQSTGEWTVTVRPDFTPGAIATAGETICYGGTPSTIDSVNPASGGDGNITYSWRSSSDNFTASITGATSSSYTPPAGLTSTTTYRRYANDGTCNTVPEQSTGEWTVTVRPDFTPGAIATAGETICYGGTPSTIGSVSAASGGDGNITYSWRSSSDNFTASITGANSSSYTPPAGLTSTTTYRRYANDGTCNTVPEQSTGEWTVTVRPDFTPGAIATAGETICYGGTPSTIGSVSAASGGDGNITYSWRSSSDNFTASITGANSSSYTPPAGLTSTTTYRRYANDGTCNTAPEQSTGEWTVTVRPDFTPGAIATAGETICYGDTPSTIGSASAASGGDGNITYSWRSSSDNFTASITGANSSSYTPPAGLTSTTTYRRYANDGTCNTVPEQSTGEWTVTVEPTPVAGNFISNPMAFLTLCEATQVSAVLTGSTGGNGIDQTEYRVFYHTYYTDWMPYNGQVLSIPGALHIEIRSRRLASYCSPSAWVHSGWSFEMMPEAGLLTKYPDAVKVCEGSQVWADLSNAFGGNGNDEKQYRKLSGSGWSNWQPYDGLALSTNGITALEIRSRRLASYCASSNWITVGWEVEPTPMAGMLQPSPAQPVVCETTSVSATLLSGTGGSGLDVSEYRTHNGTSWSSWMLYTPGSPISAAGLSHIEIRTFRQGDVCSNSGYNTVSWNIEKQAQPGVLVRQPAVAMVCEGSMVSATLVPGSGGNGTDELHYRTRTGNIWTLWQPYTSASNISTSGVAEVEVRTRRLSTQCTPSEEYIVTWLVEPTPIAFAGSDATICANDTYTMTEAQVSNASGVLWTSSGDGTFSNTGALNPTYIPGTNDKLIGLVTLTLTANTNGLCQVQSVMQLSLSTPVTPSVSITANEPVVCQGTPVAFTAVAVNGGSNPVFTWKVNGQVAGGNTANFVYVPQQGDEVKVEMLSLHQCATQTQVISNTITVNVVPINLQLLAIPAQGGQAVFTGTVAQGSTVTLTATANSGYSFLGWYAQSGQLMSADAIWQVSIVDCFTSYEARFSSNASLAGRLRYYNPIESQVPSSQFVVQLYKSGVAVTSPQNIGYAGTYSFDGLESGTDYTLRVWEQPGNNQLGNTWMWNNWGGVSGLDALIVGKMVLEEPMSPFFPWIQPVLSSPYTQFATTVGDVNKSGTLTANDALNILFRSAQGDAFGKFGNNRHDFILSGARVTNPNAMLYPQAPELVFQSLGTYAATTPAHMVYHEVNPGIISTGNNYMNIYLTAAGDLNSSYLPGVPMKTTATLAYDQVIQAAVGEEVNLPLYVDRDVVLGAVTLGLRYNTAMLDVEEVVGFEISSIDKEGGTIKVAWYEVMGRTFSADQPLLSLRARLRQQVGAGLRYMELLPVTEFASPEASILNDVHLRTLAIQSTDDTPEAGIAHYVMPNPFSDRARVSFTLPEAGRVSLVIYNQYGQMVYRLVDADLMPGQHSYELSRGDLGNSGTYYYQLQYSTGTKVSVSGGKIVLVR
ncbi:MAG: hypothetical protein IPM52_01915 [Bacteroidetes bacterium]|nr:hypothetical protein [Bacteroidota bacterium]